MNNLQIISGVSCYEKDGTVFLWLEDVARGLGFTRTAASGNEVVRWDRVDSYLSELGMPTCGHDCYIPENIFYRLAMKAKNETAERFQALVADEIIPSIRRTGSYTVPASHSRQIQHLQTLQKSLKEFRELEEQFAANATEYRKRYEYNRAHRDTCHAEVAKLERLIDACIASLAIEAVNL